MFYRKVSGTRPAYIVSDLDGQLRNTIIGQMSDMFGNSSVDFLDMAGRQSQLGRNMLAGLHPIFADLGLQLQSFTLENISMPEELQKLLDRRIGMNMVGDMGRYTQFQVAQSMPIAAANEGGGMAGAGMGLGAGMLMAQQVMNAAKPAASPGSPAPGALESGPAGGTKFCMNCGKTMPKPAKFCPECGGAQQ